MLPSIRVSKLRMYNFGRKSWIIVTNVYECRLLLEELFIFDIADVPYEIHSREKPANVWKYVGSIYLYSSTFETQTETAFWGTHTSISKSRWLRFKLWISLWRYTWCHWYVIESLSGICAQIKMAAGTATMTQSIVQLMTNRILENTRIFYLRLPGDPSFRRRFEQIFGNPFIDRIHLSCHLILFSGG